MDITPIILTVIKPLVWLSPIFITFALLKIPTVKGRIGEAAIMLIAKIKLPNDVYYPIHNVTLPMTHGTTQIDHIFVSVFGVFVVETKNMKGWIFGGEKQPKWTQKIFHESYKFQNPLYQNFKHVKALESALKLPSEVFHSVVVFTGENSFKTEMPKNVTRGIGYVNYIKSFEQAVLSEPQVLSIIEQIQTRRLEPSRKTDKQHLQYLKSRDSPDTDPKCPACGLVMVRRTAKNGANKGTRFWGCSGYPSCRTVKKSLSR